MAQPPQPSGPNVRLVTTGVTSPPPLVTLPPPLSSSFHPGLGVSCIGAGGSMGVGGCGWLWECTSALILTFLLTSFSPLWGITLVLAMLEFRQKEDWPIRMQYGLSLMRVTWPPSWIYFLCDIIIKGFHFSHSRAFSFTTSKLIWQMSLESTNGLWREKTRNSERPWKQR